MPKYRYITCGTCRSIDKLSSFRLVGSFKEFRPSSAIRVTIPDNIKLDRYPYDGYSTTQSNIQIKDLNPIVIVRYNSRMIPNVELTKKWLNGEVEPCNFHQWMRGKGYINYLRFGYITKEQHKWLSNLSENDYKKIWQIEKIPNLNKSFNFIPTSEYKNKFGEYFDEVNKAIENNQEAMSLTKTLELSKEDLFEEYAYYCFTTECDTKLHHINFKYGCDRPFVNNLISRLQMEVNYRKRMEKFKTNQEVL